MIEAQAPQGTGAEQINQHLFPFAMVEADRKGLPQQGEDHNRQGIGQGPTTHVGQGPLQGGLTQQQQGHHGNVQGAEGNADAKQRRLGHQGSGEHSRAVERWNQAGTSNQGGDGQMGRSRRMTRL